MLAHDQPRAEAVFAAALNNPSRRWWAADYGTALRDQAAMALLLKESGLLPDRLARLIAGMPGVDLLADGVSTQEQAWLAAAAAVLGRDGRPVRVALDGRELPLGPVLAASLVGPVTARNLSERAVWQSVAVTGVPAEALGAARSGMRLTRKFLALDGSTLDLDKLRQNTDFVLLLEGTAETRQAHRALVMQGLPAGWEIAGRLNAGAVPGMAYSANCLKPRPSPPPMTATPRRSP